ncbi:hypothetical protein KCP70_21005 [Salmonella enterica subsp. enterica]|nr:hypothetical protein KCP70_21005 [Salmonella enterica subsp. enterica]
MPAGAGCCRATDRGVAARTGAAKPANRLSRLRRRGISRIRNMLNRRRRKVRRGSNLCSSLPRAAIRRDASDRSRICTSLRRRKHSRNGRRRMPNNTGSRSRPSAEPIAAEPSHMPPPVIEQRRFATEPEIPTQKRPDLPVLRALLFYRWKRNAPVSVNNWRHGINRFRSR